MSITFNLDVFLAGFSVGLIISAIAVTAYSFGCSDEQERGAAKKEKA